MKEKWINIFKKSNKKDILKKGLLCIFIIIIIIVIILAIKEIKRSNNYKKELTLTATEMINSINQSKDCMNTIKDVWYNSIWKIENEKTNLYTKTNGKFNNSFNDSLQALMNDKDFKKNIYDVKNSQKEIKKSLDKLKNPPLTWKNSYQKTKDSYKDYLEITKLCTNHSGNLLSYSEKVEKVDKIINKVKKNIDY